MAGRSVSIADVASVAGVSKTTVSHVLSGRRRVSPATAAIVRKAVHDLGYVPKHYAAALRSGVTGTLGLLVPDIGNFFFAQLARGVHAEAESAGYSLILSTSEFEKQKEARYLQLLRAGAIDGLIYAAGAPPSLVEISAVSSSFPMVVVDERLAGIPGTHVTSDNLTGGQLVGDHMRGLGHRTIAYLGGPADLATTQDRLAGLRRAFEPEQASIIVRYGRYSQDDGVEGVRQLLDSGHRFSAVFGGNDLVAIGAIEALRDAGISVPDEVSVVGFDDIPLSAYVDPPLTTIHQPVFEMGTTAVRELLQSLTSPPTDERHLVLPVELVLRGSTGPALSS